MLWLKLLQTYGPVDVARAVGAEELSGYDSPRARSRLLVLLRDHSPLVVNAAIKSLAKHIRSGSFVETERSKIVDTLLEYVRDRHPELAWVAIQNLGELQATEAVPVLIQVLDDAKVGKRRGMVSVAISSLGMLQAKEAISSLYRLVLDWSDTERQLNAAEAIHRIGLEHLDSMSKQAFVALVRGDWKEVDRQGAHAVAPMNKLLKIANHEQAQPLATDKLHHIVDLLSKHCNAETAEILAETYLKISKDWEFYHNRDSDWVDQRTGQVRYSKLTEHTRDVLVQTLNQYSSHVPAELLQRLLKIENQYIDRTPNRGDWGYDDGPVRICVFDSSPVTKLAKAELMRREKSK